MSTTYLYLSTMPEALIVSMLPPMEFGAYLAVGTQKRSRGCAMFFNVSGVFTSSYFDLAGGRKECVPHPDGTPKHSVYLGVYRVLEHVPLDALESLYLVTRDGRTLELPKETAPGEFSGAYHLYDEICPVHPIIVSSLDPRAFARFITDPAQHIHVPRICFAELSLEPWAGSPEQMAAAELSSPETEHVRDCLLSLARQSKETKTVDRTHQITCWPIQVKNGFFVGDQTGLVYYPFPSAADLAGRHHDWWRSAQE